jgi:DNA-binding MarR family transcriptional regulator
MRAASDAVEREMLSALSDAERATLHDLLSRLLPVVRQTAK